MELFYIVAVSTALSALFNGFLVGVVASLFNLLIAAWLHFLIGPEVLLISLIWVSLFPLELLVLLYPWDDTWDDRKNWFSNDGIDCRTMRQTAVSHIKARRNWAHIK